jgi:hypothetical protein
MKTLLLSLAAILALASTTVSALAAGKTSSGEDWKGQSDNAEVHLGGLAGLGIFADFNAGFVLLGTASKKIIHHGFVPDVTDSVSIETEMGPIFTQGTTAFSYSLHARWDFEMNQQWTFFAIGGAAGYITGSSLNNSFALFPRFGVGSFFRVNDLILIRGEISHELIAAGVTIPLYL